MAEEIKRVITIDTTKGTKSIKQLRDEVASLTSELEDLEIGSTDYSKKLEDLVKVQDKLNVATESMQGTTINTVKLFDSVNQVAGGLAGGISAVSATFTLFGRDTENLQKTMVKLQAAIAIVQGIGGLKGLGEGILNGVKSFKALTVAMGGATTATGGLSLAMGVLRTAIVSTGIGALVVALGLLVDYLIKAASGADNLKISISQLNDVTDQWTSTYQSANTRIAGLERQRERDLAAGIKTEINIWKHYVNELNTLLADVTYEFGAVSQEYEQSITDILQNTKYFKKEFKSSGYDTWEEYTQAIIYGLRTSTNETEFFLSKLNEDQKSAYQQATDSYNNMIQKRDELATKVRDANEKVRLLELGNARKNREAKKAELDKELADRAKHNADLLSLINQYSEENRKLLLDDSARELEELNTKYQQQLDALREAKELELITQEEYQEKSKQSLEAYNKEYLDIFERDYASQLEARLNSLRETQDRESQLFANKEASLNAGFSGNYQTRVYDLGLLSPNGEFFQSKTDVDNEYTNTLAYNEQLFNLTKERIDRENQLLKEQQLIIMEQFHNKLITEQEYADQSQSIKLQQEANDIAISQAANAREEADLQAFKDRQAKKQQALQATAQVASSLAGAAANIAKQAASDDKRSEKERAKAFKVYKSLATTQAIIDTISSAQGAYKAMVGIPYVGPILAVAAAAAAIAAGTANVMAIQNEQMPSSGGSGGTVQTAAPNALSLAPIDYTRNLLGDRETEELNKPIKCYVVESDITETQNQVAVTESNASF